MAIPRIAEYELPPLDTVDNKVAWQLDPQRAVLLVHDLQNYFVNFYYRDCEPQRSLLTNAGRLIESCRAREIPVVYTAQPPNQSPSDRALLTDFWGPGLSAADAAAEIVREVTPLPGETVYTKWRYSAFQRTSLGEDMQRQGRNQLLVCGIYAHIGILATALEAFMRDIQTFVVGDAVADFSPEDQRFALQYIAQRCGKVATLQQLATVLAPPAALTREAMMQDIAAALQVPVSDLRPDDNLMDFGLDSIRLMSLVEKWHAAGAPVEFVELAEAATADEWWDQIQAKPSQDEPVAHE